MAITCAFPRSLKIRGAVPLGSAGCTVHAQDAGGWTGMGPGLLLLQRKNSDQYFLILLRSYHIILQEMFSVLALAKCHAVPVLLV